MQDSSFCSTVVMALLDLVLEIHRATHVQGYKFTKKMCEMYQENSRYAITVNTEHEQNRKEMDEWGSLFLCRCPLPADRAGKACTAASSAVMNRCFSHLLINTFNTSIFRRVHFSRNMGTAWVIHAEIPVGCVLIMTLRNGRLSECL